MTTSENGFAVTEDKQEQGEYILGAVATEDEGRLTVISAPMMIDSQLTDAFTTVENLKLFMNAVTSNFDDVENTAIDPKSLAAVSYTHLDVYKRQVQRIWRRKNSCRSVCCHIIK